MRVSRRPLCTCLMGIIACAQLSCNERIDSDVKEIGRIASPDSLVEAIIMRDIARGLGTADNGILIYLIPSGSKVTRFDGEEFFAEKVSGLSVRWAKPQLLEIHYRKARIFVFRNLWQPRQSLYPMFLDAVEIKLMKDGDEMLEPIMTTEIN